ncbi:MAG: hypothetical protein JO256_06495 [Alphaproteobacteria bacterium]|nr:hypothetical protein [Alphaproteobacteria bacterium]
MGMAPRDVRRLSLWEFACCWNAWLSANTSDGGPSAPSDEEYEAMKRLHGDG